MTPDSHDAPHIDLHLGDIRDLFVAPEPDPFGPYDSDDAGLEILVNRLAPLKLLGVTPRITVYLPADKLTPSLAAETRAALDRHLERRIAWAQNELLASRRDGWRSFAYALLLSGLVLVLLAAAYLLAWPTWAQAIAYAVFIVVAWVAMWWAAEALLFDWLASRRRMTILRAIQVAELQLLPEPPPAPGPPRAADGADR